MLRKIRFILMFISLSVCISLMSNTYSRYVSDTTGNIEMTFARWQILVNTIDITTNKESIIEFEPIIIENDNVANNTFAPSSQGYFDIEINPSNVDVSFKYLITLTVENENMPDVKITDYALLPEDFIEEDPLTLIPIIENEIENDVYFDNNIEDFEFEIITIRIFFEWYEGEGELMDDEDDTEIGLLAVTEELKLEISANISFEQIIE